MRTSISALLRRYGFVLATFWLLALQASLALADGWMGVVVGTGKIMDGNTVLKEVPAGTRLWVFSENNNWYEVKVPGSETRSWIAAKSLNNIVDNSQASTDIGNEIDKLIEEGNTLANENKLAEALESKRKTLAKIKQHYGEVHPLTAEMLRSIGWVATENKEYAQAKASYQAALAIMRAVQGNTSATTVNMLAEFGQKLRDAGELGEAKKTLQEALALIENVRDAENVSRANLLNGLGNVAMDLKDDASALKYYEESLTLWKKDVEANHENVIILLTNLGTLHLVRNEDAPADKYYAEALAIAKKYYGEKHANTIAVIKSLGGAAYDRGQFKAAQKYAEQALALTREVFGNEHLSTAECLATAGGYAADNLDFKPARQYLEESLHIKQKLLKADDPSIGYTFNALGCLAGLQDDFSSAKKHLQDAIAIFQRTNDLNGLTDTHSRLAELYLNLGDFPTARKHGEESLALRRKIPGRWDREIAYDLSLLGNIAEGQGNDTLAEKYYLEALALRRKALRPTDLDIARSLSELGNIALHRKDLKLARQQFEEGLKILRQGTDEESLLYLFLNMGNLEQECRDYQAAQKNYDQALAISLKFYGNDGQQTAAIRKSMGELAAVTKDYAASWKHYEEALAIERRLFGKEHPNTIDAQQLLALLAIDEEDHDAAQRRLDDVRRMMRRYVQYVLPSLSPLEQLKFLEGDYQEAWAQCLSFGKLSGDSSAANASAAWLINGKAIAHEALAERELLARDLANPQLAPLVRELQDVRAQLATLALSAPKPSEAEAHQTKLTKLGATEFRLAQKLAEANGREAIVRDWVELENIRRTIPQDGVYLDLISVPIYDFAAKKAGPPRYLAWVIPAHRQGKVQLLDLGEAQAIDESIQKLLATVADAGSKNSLLQKEGEIAATAKATKDLQAVTDLVLKPLLPQLADKKQLILSPDGALWLLPWAALPVAENKCLLEQCSVRYVLSGRDLIRHDGTSKLSTSAPAIFANPDFNLAGQAAKTALKALLPQTSFNTDTARGEASQSSLPQVGSLPFTALEGDAVQPLLAKLAGNTPQSFQQEKALEAVVKNLRRPKQVVFATHGFFLPDQQVKQREEKQLLASNDTRSLPALTTDNKPVENPLLRCGLLLAGCNSPRTAGLDDGILTGLEIVGMDLRGTELVVLSACETGIGKVRNGEGVAGLRQAFQLAGAQSVVSTLWTVPDRDSALIMQDFFTNLAAGQSKADALRNAQLKRIAARRDKGGAAHPFFWAAWTVTGE